MQILIADRYFSSYSYFHFLRKKREWHPLFFHAFGFFKKFDIPNYDRARGKESLYQEMILPVNSTQALLPNLIAFGLSDEHEK